MFSFVFVILYCLLKGLPGPPGQKGEEGSPGQKVSENITCTPSFTVIWTTPYLSMCFTGN